MSHYKFFHLHDVMDVFIRALPLCDSLRYVTSEVLIGVLHVRINHSLTHIRSIQWRIREGGGGVQSASGPIRKVCV